jgi:hypothetical protein
MKVTKMTEDYSSKRRNGTGDGGYDDDRWTKRLDLFLKALIALATVGAPVYMRYLVVSAKDEVKASTSKDVNANTASVNKKLEEHDETLNEVNKATNYTKAVTADWWAERTGSMQAAKQAEEARNKLEEVSPLDVPPPSPNKNQ